MKTLIVRLKERNLLLTALWILLGTLALTAYLFPIRTTTLRFALLILVISFWGMSFPVCRKRKWLCAVIGVVPIPLALLLLPGQATDKSSLREEYVRSLKTYSGTLYIWGGESRLGIDCSGLTRCGLIHALFSVGLRERNAASIRESLSLWWNDCSAKALGEGYRDLTHEVLTTDSLNGMDYSLILPGDLAVTDDGQHILAYLGERRWIEADPQVWRVIEVQVPAPDNVWFERKMKIVRWNWLDDRS